MITGDLIAWTLRSLAWHQYSIYFVDTGDINIQNIRKPSCYSININKVIQTTGDSAPKKVISVQEQMTGTEDSGASCDARLGRCGV